MAYFTDISLTGSSQPVPMTTPTVTTWGNNSFNMIPVFQTIPLNTACAPGYSNPANFFPLSALSAKVLRFSPAATNAPLEKAKELMIGDICCASCGAVKARQWRRLRTEAVFKKHKVRPNKGEEVICGPCAAVYWNNAVTNTESRKMKHMRTEAWTEEQLKCFHTKLFTQSPLAAVLKKPEKQDDAVSLVTQQAKYLRDVKRICATHHIPFPFKAESQSVNLASQIPESRSELKISDLSHVTNTEEWELNVNFAYNESLARILKIYKKQAKQSQVLEGLEKVIAG